MPIQKLLQIHELAQLVVIALDDEAIKLLMRGARAATHERRHELARAPHIACTHERVGTARDHLDVVGHRAPGALEERHRALGTIERHVVEMT